jgi:hypothetical protein
MKIYKVTFLLKSVEYSLTIEQAAFSKKDLNCLLNIKYSDFDHILFVEELNYF